MPDETSDIVEGAWTRVADVAQLDTGPRAVKIGGRQIAIFLRDGTPHACNNRCPHEGYPLVEGVLDRDCVLTCNWHNWKFDLTTGTNLYGGDNLRIYPARIAEGAVWVDVRDPPASQRIAQLLLELDGATSEFDSPRIARELARLGKAGAPPEVAVERAVIRTHDYLRYGMTHAFAAADAWLRLRDQLADEARRLACATEALAYIGFDTLRESAWPFATEREEWNPARFAAAIEAQDEAAAAALLNGAIDAGIGFRELEPALTEAALAHYLDFGHSLIYLVHAGSLSERLGAATLRPLLLAWMRSVIYATREDLLPDFRGLAAAVTAWPVLRASTPDIPVAAGDFEGRLIRDVIAQVLAAAGSMEPLAIHHLLMETAASHLLRFDQRFAVATTNSVADNVGWLDFSHALSFGHAVRAQCIRMPQLWPRGLLQLALFVGRNSAYLDPQRSADQVLQQWRVDDEAAFAARAVEQIVDHGIGVPIFPAHWLKTWMAVRDEIVAGVPAATAAALLAAVNRLLAVRFKERHALRMARQALAFVGRKD